MNARRHDQLLQKLKTRFDGNMVRHRDLDWIAVSARLEGNADALGSVHEMEASGGEPDVIGYDEGSDLYTFCDCSAESPSGRRSLCYDQEALSSRKENKPGGSAWEIAAAMGISIIELSRPAADLMAASRPVQHLPSTRRCQAPHAR